MLGQALMLIHTGRAPTRSVLTSALGVSRATAGTLVGELQSLDLIRVDESGRPEGGQQGRPSHRLSVGPAGPVALAAQLHPDGYQVAVVGLGARVVAAAAGGLDVGGGPARALGEIAAAGARLVAACASPCVGAGLAVPSAVASIDGTLVGPLYLDWPTGTPVRDLFGGQLRLAGVAGPGGRPLACSVGNDINLAALAEHRHGAGRGSSHLLMLATGRRGVGGALVLDGALYTGSTGLGMEAGHVSVDAAGQPCPCGGRGCLNVETDAARFLALARRAPLRAPAGQGAGQGDAGQGGRGQDAGQGGTALGQAIDVLRQDYAADPVVREAAAAIIGRLGVGLAGLVNVINPDRVLLGGLHRYLLEADPVGLRAAVAAGSPWGRGGGVPLLPAALEQASIVGAAEIAWQPVLDNPAMVAGTLALD